MGVWVDGLSKLQGLGLWFGVQVLGLGSQGFSVWIAGVRYGA